MIIFMVREESQAMAIDYTGMWAAFKQTLPSLSDPVRSSDGYQIRTHTLHSHNATNASYPS